jgi:hypothetical protein
MSKTLYELQEQLEKVQAELKSIRDEAGDELDIANVKSIDGTLSEKLSRIEALVAEEAELKQLISKVTKVKETINEIVVPDVTPPASSGTKTLGALVVEAPEFKSGVITLRGVDTKALFGLGSGWSPDLRRSDRVAEAPYILPTILDVIPVGSTNQNSYVYMAETLGTNVAAEVAEGGTYPEATVVYTEISEPLRKIAVTLPVSDEALADEPRVREIIDNRLTFFVRQRLANQVINGNGTSPNLRGILNRSGINTVTGTTAANILDKVLNGVRLVKDAMAEPDAIVLSSSSWETIMGVKTTDGAYVYGSPANGGPATLWGIPVVVSNQLPSGTYALIGAFREHSELILRSEVNIEVGYVNDDFARGRKAVRADVRAALAVYRAAAFTAVTA